MSTQVRTKVATLINEALDVLEKAGVTPGSPEQTARAALRQAKEALEAPNG